jgi:hypothetical protein
MANKKKRTPKTSKGIHGGGGKVRTLTEVQKVNLGGGILRSMEPIGKRHKATPEPTSD